jgi:hypothetical protein
MRNESPGYMRPTSLGFDLPHEVAPTLNEEMRRDRFTAVFGGLPARFVFKAADEMLIIVRGSRDEGLAAKGRLDCTAARCGHPPVEFAVQGERAIEFPWTPLRGWTVEWPVGDAMPTVKCPRHGGGE